jgi:hypothetical protein
MRTTEVFIDQVLIGFVVLAIFILPFLDMSLPFDVSAAQGVVLTGTAYLIGIPFDRFANTLLSGLEQRHRLRYAWDKRVPAMDDPFPEEQLITKVLTSEGAAADWLNYLRSRVRLSRALAAFLPALTAAIALNVTDNRELSKWILLLVSAVYLAGYGLFSLKQFELPRTHERHSDSHWRRHGGVRSEDIPEFCSCRSFIWDPSLIVLGVPFVIVFALAAFGEGSRSELVLIGVSGAALTIVAVSAWRKIRLTLMTFLRSIDNAREPKVASATV